MQKLVSQRESESKLHDTYEQELTAQTRLAQIYKGQFLDYFPLQRSHCLILYFCILSYVPHSLDEKIISLLYG
jgi:hypothetical protein